MAGKAKLAIVASDPQVLKDVTKSVAHVIGEVVDITGFSLRSIRGPIYDFPVVLTSHNLYVSEAKVVFPDSDIIPGYKTINGYNLEKVIRLPKGKKVLVINTPKSIADETIQNLLDLGINHLEYVPYWVGSTMKLEGIDTAIAPALGHLCPAGIENIIDIGPRIINVVTFLDLLNKLKLDMSYLTKFINCYTNLLMINSCKLADILGKSEILRREQEIILNQIDEGIVSANSSGRITLVNPAFNKIFNSEDGELIDKSVKSFFNGINLSHDISDVTEIISKDTVFSYHGKNIVCNKIPVITDQEERSIYTFKEVSRIQEMEEEVRRKLNKKGYVAKYNFDDIWGNNAILKYAKEQARKFSGTDHTILIIGESGTGKELFAQAIHLDSHRRRGPFLAINFAAIPESLVESELFGYEGGAFTGAKKEGKPGLFEQAHGGTLLLDEIGDAPLSIQARLLRVLQEKEIMRVGGDKIIPINVRIIAATNKDLTESVTMNKFRADLFYRLNVLPIATPPLRKYKDDILTILGRYLEKKYNITKEFSNEIKQILLQYNWPGNIRELFNVADYIYYTSQGRAYIDINDIPVYLRQTIEKEVFNETGKLIDKLLDGIEKKDEIKNIYDLLKILEKAPNGSLGRNSILNHIRKKDTTITEHKVKRYLILLHSIGLISTGKTRQGSSITTLGSKFIDNIYSFKLRNGN